MHRRFTFLTVFALFCLLGSGFIPAAPTTSVQAKPLAACGSDTTRPNCEWVHAGAISGGCRETGTCNSDVSAPLSGLYERVADRQHVDTDFSSADLSQHGGYPTFVRRERCWIDVGGGRYYQGWSAGTWHHGATWQRVNGTWYDSRHHWAFYHEDACNKVAPGPTITPTPQATPTPPPPPAPGTLTIQVWQCRVGGAGLATTIMAYAGSWSQSTYSSSVTFSVPGQYSTVSYSIDQPAGWTISNRSGTTAVGSRVTAVADNPNVCNAPTPPPGSPTPTEPPAQPCDAQGAYDGSVIPISVTGPGADVSSVIYNVNAGTNLTAPNPPPTQGRITPGLPLNVRFDFSGIQYKNFEPNHSGMSQIRFGITDLTTGQVIVHTETTDIKELKDSQGRIQVWGRSLQLTTVRINGATFSGTGNWWAWQPNWSNWGQPSSTPQIYKYYRQFGPSTVTFTPQTGHRYEAWAMAGRGPCRIQYWRWTRAIFGDPNAPTPTPCVGGACPTPTMPIGTPTPLPTPTPPPPPPPPAPRAEMRLRMHSVYDPDEGGSSPYDAVHTSSGTEVSWPQGEILNWSPKITLQPLTQPPADPYYGQLYRFEQELVNWSFVSSMGEPAERGGGCKTVQTDAVLDGCAHTYLDNPTESQMPQQSRAIWSVGGAPGLPSSVYNYTLPQLQPVDLVVQAAIHVRVIDTRTGQVVASETTPLEQTFTVRLVVPRSVR